MGFPLLACCARYTGDVIACEARKVAALVAGGCCGGIFGRNCATCGAADAVIPVDVYIPDWPPNPDALLHGILTAIGRVLAKR